MTQGVKSGNTWALGGLLVLVLGCCVAGGVLAVLRGDGRTQGAAAGSAVNAPRDESASVDGPFRYAAVRRTREAPPAGLDPEGRVDAGGFVAGVLRAPASADVLQSVSAPSPEPAVVVPVAPAVFSRLRALGLLGTPKPGGPVAASVIDLLEQSGRARRFAWATLSYDETARTLAELARPVLDDVLFEVQQRAPATVQDAVEPEVLVAWSRGERFETVLGPALEWENLEAVVGLLNVLARSRESSVRFVLNDDSGLAEVVVGLDRSLRAAIAEGLIHVWSFPQPSTDTAGDQFLKALRGEPFDPVAPVAPVEPAAPGEAFDPSY